MGGGAEPKSRPSRLAFHHRQCPHETETFVSKDSCLTEYYTRGRGKIFYFRPGHESYPTYRDPNVRRVIANAARWAAPSGGPKPVFGNAKPRNQA